MVIYTQKHDLEKILPNPYCFLPLNTWM